MEAINKGRRVWVIRGNNSSTEPFSIQRAIVTSSYSRGNGLVCYRVKIIIDGKPLYGTHPFNCENVFTDNREACVTLADRLKRFADSLLSRAGVEPLDCGLVSTCRHGIDG